jgi:hypothetical protein
MRQVAPRQNVGAPDHFALESAEADHVTLTLHSVVNTTGRTFFDCSPVQASTKLGLRRPPYLHVSKNRPPPFYFCCIPLRTVSVGC